MTRTPFLTAEWRHLVMLSYPIDPGALEPLVPLGTTLDSFAGRTFVSVVGFLFLRTRVRRLAVPGHRNFEEVNLRFYVRREVAGESRRGVVFVKEIVPRRAIAAVARWAYNENYVAMPMRHRIDAAADGPSVAYGWKPDHRWNEIRVRCHGRPAEAAPDSIEAFITEHYYGYSRQRDGATVEYRVEHPRWAIHPVAEASLECDVESLYGAAFVEALGGPAASALYADGSAVTVYTPERVA